MLIYLEKQRTSILTSGQIIQIMGIFAIRTWIKSSLRIKYWWLLLMCNQYCSYFRV
jgi:hypothetical protein